MANRYFLAVRLVAIVLFASRCVVTAWTLAPFVADLSFHGSQLASWAQHTFGVVPALAADVVSSSSSSSSAAPSPSALLNVDFIVSQLPTLQAPELPELKIEVPDVSQAGEYVGDVGNKFGRVGSKFVKMSGLTNAPQTAEALARQTQDVVGGLGKAVDDIKKLDLPTVDLKKVTDIIPKDVAAEDPKVGLFAWPAWTPPSLLSRSAPGDSSTPRALTPFPPTAPRAGPREEGRRRGGQQGGGSRPCRRRQRQVLAG